MWSWWFHHDLRAQTPSTADWERIAQAIKRDFKPGDRVAITPFWATMGERAFVQADLNYQYVRWVAREDWPDEKRLWVVSAYRRFVDRNEFIERGAKPEASFSLGPIKVERFLLPWARPTFRFDEQLPNAEVFHKRGANEISCGEWNGDEARFICNQQADWQHVGQLTVEAGEALRSAIWAHPINNTDIRIRYHQVPLQDVIVVHHGLTEYAAAEPEGAPVFIDIYVDGRNITRLTQRNVRGWLRDEVYYRGKPGELHEVEFSISMPRDGRRHFMFNAYTQ